MATARLFVACPVRLELDCLAADVARATGGRAVPPGTYHVTLAFIGERAETEVPARADAIRAAAKPHAPIDATTTHLGAFPDERHARVAWLGLDAPRLAALARDVQMAVMGDVERRDFRAHVTLARLRNSRDLRGHWPPEPPATTIRFDAVVLYRSRLEPAGPTYLPTARVAL